MGKQKKKDRLYVRSSEWAEQYGGLHIAEIRGRSHQKLPLNCCSLSLKPFETPVCLKDGSIYEAQHVIWYIKKYSLNPVSGLPASIKELRPVKFHKNEENKTADPITQKAFAGNSHIALNRVSGYVYSYDTVEQMNKKAKNFTDLITSEKFNWSKDLVIIRDPNKPEVGQIDLFHYMKAKQGDEVQEQMDALEEAAKPEAEQVTDTSHIRDSDAILRVREERKRVADERAEKGESAAPLSQPWKIEEEKAREKLREEMKLGGAGSGGPAVKRLKHTAHTTGAAAASFTSTAAPKANLNEMRDMTDEEMRKRVYDRVKKKKAKGYIRFHVQKWGTLNCELHCDMVPIACDNFFQLAAAGYYDGTCFHRCIKNFMIQGGDPDGTGKGGRSAFDLGTPFRDEFDSRLTYNKGAMLGMANSGKNTNKSQFFITFKMAEHLTNKHTLFGRVVGGVDILELMNKHVEVDETDRPKPKITLQGVTVFKNPFKEVEQEIADEEDEVKQKEREKEKDKDNIQWLSQNIDPMRDHKNRFTGGVGKYLNLPKAGEVDEAAAFAGLSKEEKEEAMIAMKPKTTGKFSNFSGF